MVEFGKTLAQSKRSDWADCYLDYDRLKELLQQANAEKTKRPIHHKRSQSYTILFGDEPPGSEEAESDAFRKHDFLLLEFRRDLDLEIEKVVLFSLEEQGRLAKELQCLGEQRQSCLDHVAGLWKEYHTRNGLIQPPKRSLLRDTHRAYQQIAYHVLEYVQFVELNVTAVRKILKKHDKNHPPISHDYLSRFTSHVDSHLDQLYHYGGLSALIATLQRAFAELHQVECFIILMMNAEIPLPPKTEKHHRSLSAPLLSHGSSVTLSTSTSTSTSISTISYHESSIITATASLAWDSDPSKVLIPLPISSKGHPIFARLANSANLPTEYTCVREPLLEQIQIARSRLQQSTKYVEMVAAQSLFFEDAEDDTYDPPLPDRKKQISSLLNLASTFLYMTNYYIVAPTTGKYAIKLGSSEAMAGVIIGMTPNAALVATVLYGWWSNHSYKSALLFAAGCSLIGNIAYAMALNYHSIELVMVGRFLNGFGSARSINRRFIADTFGREDRTAASAAFVTAGALGMAAGPGIAACLGQIDSTSVWWTEETAPGWVMMVIWAIYLVTAFLYFEEPDRSHLFGKKVETGIPGEMQSLLSPIAEEPAKRHPPLYRNIPVMITLWIYFVLKLILECLLSSCALLTGFYFGWDSQRIATFLAFLGLLMFPANVGVARLSHQYEDRELIQGTLLVMLVSVLGILSFSKTYYSPIQYVVFGVCIFVSTNVLEGPNMSLLSKTIPKQWAKGIFNSGFLATEAGTAARSVGDVLITAAAFRGVDNLLNSTFIPLLVLVGISIGWTKRCFDHMVEDDDDQDSRHSDTTGDKDGKTLLSIASLDTINSSRSSSK